MVLLYTKFLFGGVRHEEIGFNRRYQTRGAYPADQHYRNHRQEAGRRGFTRIGLLGTIFTITIHVQALITEFAAEN